MSEALSGLKEWPSQGGSAVSTDAVDWHSERDQTDEDCGKGNPLQRSGARPAERGDSGKQQEEEHQQQGDSDEMQQPRGNGGHVTTIQGCSSRVKDFLAPPWQMMVVPADC